VALPLTASAALRYWNMARQRHCRRLARYGKPAVSLLTPSSSEPRTPAGKARVLDARKWLRERDGLSAGGRWIRTFGPPSEGQRFRGSQSELPGRLVMPTRGQQSIGPQLGRASWAGARRSRFLLKANCGGSNAGRKKLFLYGFESTERLC
jgi:hypothetical protein